MPLCVLSNAERLLNFVERSVTEHGEEDVASASGEGDEGLVVAFALGDLAVVVGPGDGVAQCREGGQEQCSFEYLVASPGRMFAADR